MIPFFCDNYSISSKIKLTVIDIKYLNEELITTLDQNFVFICEGKSNSDLMTVKKRVFNLYEGKDERWIIGATAEFFIHLYIKLIGFKQECLFLNLEENSIKKGFDGYYSLNGDEWLMESKAGTTQLKEKIHANKVKIAMKDLEDKVTGNNISKKKNNPWQNAYCHASHYDVGTSEEIRKSIQKLSKEYINKIYHSIEEFNVMPCGTLFLSGTWDPPRNTDILEDIKEIVGKLKGKKIHVICVTQKSVDIFYKYIKMGV